MLLLANGDKKIVDGIEETSLVHIPTVDEAIDFIFMDQLEKEFGEDGD